MQTKKDSGPDTRIIVGPYRIPLSRERFLLLERDLMTGGLYESRDPRGNLREAWRMCGGRACACRTPEAQADYNPRRADAERLVLVRLSLSRLGFCFPSSQRRTGKSFPAINATPWPCPWGRVRFP